MTEKEKICYGGQRITLWVKGSFPDADHSCDTFAVTVYSKVSHPELDRAGLVEVHASADPRNIALWMAADEMHRGAYGFYSPGSLLFYKWEE